MSDYKPLAFDELVNFDYECFKILSERIKIDTTKVVVISNPVDKSRNWIKPLPKAKD